MNHMTLTPSLAFQPSVDVNLIDWGAGDFEYGYQASDFEWKETAINLSNVGCERFIEELKLFIESEILGEIEEIGCPDLETYVLSKLDGDKTYIHANARLVDWVDMLMDNNLTFEEPIQLTEVQVKEKMGNSVVERSIICDGWHRLGLAALKDIKQIPVIIGLKKND